METRMIDLVLKVAVERPWALLVGARMWCRSSRLAFQNKPRTGWRSPFIALVFAIVNSYIKPIVKTLAMPIGFLTMGLVAFRDQRGLLLGTAWIVNQAKDTLDVGFASAAFRALRYETMSLRGRWLDRDQRRWHGPQSRPGAAQESSRLLASEPDRPGTGRIRSSLRGFADGVGLHSCQPRHVVLSPACSPRSWDRAVPSLPRRVPLTERERFRIRLRRRPLLFDGAMGTLLYSLWRPPARLPSTSSC